ncbi:MAG: hypothetical protein JW958_04230 [Candidatus Eisenbacteria bacterium]|nr:hypothetical protein [Candidatus Eisenbacteria bacterium]
MIRIIAVILIGTGAWILVGLGSSYMNMGEAFRHAAGFAGTGAAILLAGQLLAPILKIVAGLGLFTRRRWSWTGALVALALDIVALGVSIYRFHGFTGTVPPTAPDGSAGGTVVETSSIVPVYLICLLSLACFALMSTKALRGKWANRLETA